MKSSRVLLIAFFSLFYVSLNAQFYVGGNFGFTTTGGSVDNGTTNTDRPSSFGFNFAPHVGKFLSESIAVGVGLDYSFNRSKTPGDPEIISRNNSIGLVPFLRYYAIRLDKFSIFGQGSLGLFLSNSSTKTGATTTDGPKVTRLAMNIYPGLAYDLSDRISLETSLNFLSFGSNNSTTKTGSIKTHSSSFNFGGGLDNIVNIGAITVGAIYKF